MHFTRLWNEKSAKNKHHLKLICRIYIKYNPQTQVTSIASHTKNAVMGIGLGLKTYRITFCLMVAGLLSSQAMLLSSLHI